MFQEVEGIEIFKMNRDIVPENSRCISNCLPESSVGKKMVTGTFTHSS